MAAVGLAAVLALFILGGLLFALPIMLLFNSIVVERVHVAPLSFWDAWGLGILCGLLFKATTTINNKKG